DGPALQDVVAVGDDAADAARGLQGDPQRADGRLVRRPGRSGDERHRGREEPRPQARRHHDFPSHAPTAMIASPSPKTRAWIMVAIPAQMTPREVPRWRRVLSFIAVLRATATRLRQPRRVPAALAFPVRRSILTS